MGFTSWKCAVSKQSIPAAPAAINVADSEVVLVTPRRTYLGTYDGYAKLRGPGINKDTGLPRDPMVKTFVTDDEDDIISIFLAVGHDLYGCKTLEECQHEDNWDRIQKSIKLVKAKFFVPGTMYHDLKVSENCRRQGYFYEREGEYNSPAYPPKKTAAAFEGTPRPINQIAREIFQVWGIDNVYFAAKPYLMAMQNLNHIRDRHLNDTAETVIQYFLNNAKTFKGEDAKRLKAELKAHLPKRK